MKKTLFLAVFAVFAFIANAQVQAIDGLVELQKGQNKHSSVIELNYPPDIVKEAIKESMSKQGIKEQKVKGMQVFRGVKLEGDDELTDLYFKVDQKSRKEKETSVVHLVVGRSNENIALRSEHDRHKSEHGKAFLTGIVPTIAAHHLEVSINDQSNVLKKSEKKLKGLQDDQVDLEKRIQNLQDKLVQNKKDQETQTADVARQREVLQAMQSRRTPTTSTTR